MQSYKRKSILITDEKYNLKFLDVIIVEIYVIAANFSFSNRITSGFFG
ncbi:hypothetical protein FLAT13_01856 [Flavobacterium salmonis]|uniref:Uncharacterized protein n=1 Tax=Flavobacterium salmonis TaxID=2654844 RepID=A0A6V6YW67_9FLAO|nr:hypothetical protein FLAT13_01856 [Flavobacterium salmonis]